VEEQPGLEFIPQLSPQGKTDYVSVAEPPASSTFHPGYAPIPQTPASAESTMAPAYKVFEKDDVVSMLSSQDNKTKRRGDACVAYEQPYFGVSSRSLSSLLLPQLLVV
jgi:hypothetical protein